MNDIDNENMGARVETRGIAVYLAPTATRQEIIDRVERYIATGFNFLVVKVFASGRVIYPSTVAAEVFGIREKHLKHAPDPVAMLLETARMHGLPVYAGFELLEHARPLDGEGTLAGAAPDWFIPEAWGPARAVLEARRAGAGAASAPEDGRARARWLSPIHPDARRFLGSLIVEALMAYPFEGLYLERMALPAATDESVLTDKATAALLKRGGDHGDFFEAKRKGAKSSERGVDEWNDWFARKIRELITYIRQRLYKARPHLVMMLESLEGADAGNGARAGDLLQVPWRDALDLVAELIAPRFALEADGAVGPDEIAASLDDYGTVSPVMPVFELRGADSARETFDRVRRSSALGFLVDAGRPLLERQWRLFEEMLSGKAMPAHTEPAEAYAAVVEEVCAMAGEESDLAAVLRDMDRALDRATDAAQLNRTRKSVMNNLIGLLDKAGTGELTLPDDPVRWRIVRGLGLLVRLQAIVHSRGQMDRETPYFS